MPSQLSDLVLTGYCSYIRIAGADRLGANIPEKVRIFVFEALGTRKRAYEERCAVGRTYTDVKCPIQV